MKKRVYRSASLIAIFSLLAILVFSIGTAAVNVGDNVISRHGAGNMARSAESDTNSGIMLDDSYEGNIDSGTDGKIDENDGTGELGIDTSNNHNGSSTEGPVESFAQGVVTDAADMVGDATNAVEDATGGNMWGIIIAIVIIAAAAAVILAIFTKKK